MGQRGNPNWVKGGPSPNPGGRPKAPTRLRELYDENDTDEEIFNTLVKWMRSDNPKASIAAMEKLHDWRYGKTPVVNDDGEVVKETTLVIHQDALEDE